MTETEMISIAKTIGQTLATTIAHEIVSQAKPALPLSVQLWNRTHLSEYLSRKKTALNKLICHPDFPQPIRLPSEQGKPQPLWRAADVIKWVETQQQHFGRPRSV
ncbi:MAG: hypothetical protein IT497_02660 [Ottowia sp.]|nr:hypothetical protein [Ottowia sp.]